MPRALMSPALAAATAGPEFPDGVAETRPRMFTVCPKCALTLVVTAADLKVAQGYVRCGRCSNVFNAIVALSEDRGQQGSSSSSGGASTTVIRKAPSISEDPPPDPLSDTGESEAIYAEPQPDPAEVKFQEVFV